jgi:hypothetical protein
MFTGTGSVDGVTYARISIASITQATEADRSLVPPIVTEVPDAVVVKACRIWQVVTFDAADPPDDFVKSSFCPVGAVILAKV